MRLPVQSLIGIPQNEPNILLMSSILAHFQVADVGLTQSAIKESVNTDAEFDVFHRVVWPDDSIHWFLLKGGRLRQGPDTVVCGIAIDGKWAAELKRSAMSLGTRILKLQDEERRKIGRELHDSLGQYLAALKMNLIALKETSAACEEARGSAECISDCVTLVGQCLQETRTLSHLLHPPLLDEVGFVSAAKWFVEGFATRSGLLVRCDIPFDLPRFGNNSELCLFRVLQETSPMHTHTQVAVP